MAWYKHWFNHPLYLELYRHRDDEEARQAVNLFLNATGLTPGSRILDLGCGNGRHAFDFVQRGMNTAAMDLSPLLLDTARNAAHDTGIALPLVRADMRHIPFRRAFDGVAQLFTAFGYFESDEENASVMNEVSRIIRPGGWYFLDFLNAPYVEDTLAPRTETRSSGVYVVQERWIREGRVNKSITIRRDGETEAEFTESVRMYTFGELHTMMQAHGFAVEHCFGDYGGLPLNSTSPRCILLGRRTKEE